VYRYIIDVNQEGGVVMRSGLSDSQKLISEMDASQRIIIYCMSAERKPIKDKSIYRKLFFYLRCRSRTSLIIFIFFRNMIKKALILKKIDENIAVISNSGYVSGS